MAFAASTSPLLSGIAGQDLPCIDHELDRAPQTFIVSNRLPFRIENGNVLPGDGGLVTALLPVHRAGRCYWVGDGGFSALGDEIAAQMLQKRLIDVKLDRELAAAHYNGASNGAIWPLFHYFPAMCVFNPRDWEAYKAVNEKFADVICSLADANDTVWVHDYQLMLLPALLRKRVPALKIGYFHHIPFPATEVLKIHPSRDALLQGVLGADVVGFHTLEYVRNFAGAVSRVLGYDPSGEDLHVEDRVVRVGAFPLGIDCGNMVRAMAGEGHEAAMAQLVDTLPRSQKVLLGVDRLDYTKGIPERLHAFDAFLTSHPEWHGRVTLVMLCVPSRTHVGKYAELRENIECLVSRINGQYGRTGWVPVLYFFQTRSLPELTALYARADVCLVTPLRDGLNLVCKEYCACHPQGDGVLVLSEFAGAAYEMSEALLVNPSDQVSFVAALAQALNMDDGERTERMQALHKRVLQADNLKWSGEFLGAVEDIAGRNVRYQSHLLDDGALKQITAEVHGQLGVVPAGPTQPLVVIDSEIIDSRAFKPRSRSSAGLSPLIACTPPGRLVLITSTGKQEADASWPHKLLPCWLIAERGGLIRSPDGSWLTVSEPEPLGQFRAEVLRTLHSRAVLVPESTVVELDTVVSWRLGRGTVSLAAPIVLETAHALDQLLARSPWMCVRMSTGVHVKLSRHTVAAALDVVVGRMGVQDPALETLHVITVGNRWSDPTLYEWQPGGPRAPLPALSPSKPKSPAYGSSGSPGYLGSPQAAFSPSTAPAASSRNVSIAVGSPISVARYVVPNTARLGTILAALATA